jgi:Icc-related predicted phosphoesterase
VELLTMRLWVLSDLHLETGSAFSPRLPDFDCLVCAGDVWNDIGQSIATVAKLAHGRPSVLVAGKCEYWSDDPIEVGRILAEHAGVHFLECEQATIGCIRFAGATLWEPDDSRFASAATALAEARADVVVTHYPPTRALLSQLGAPVWIYGHVHGRSVQQVGGTRAIQNALGYPGEAYVGLNGARAAPFDPSFVIEVTPRNLVADE